MNIYSFKNKTSFFLLVFAFIASFKLLSLGSRDEALSQAIVQAVESALKARDLGEEGGSFTMGSFGIDMPDSSNNEISDKTKADRQASMDKFTEFLVVDDRAKFVSLADTVISSVKDWKTREEELGKAQPVVAQSSPSSASSVSVSTSTTSTPPVVTVSSTPPSTPAIVSAVTPPSTTPVDTKSKSSTPPVPGAPSSPSVSVVVTTPTPGSTSATPPATPGSTSTSVASTTTVATVTPPATPAITPTPSVTPSSSPSTPSTTAASTTTPPTADAKKPDDADGGDEKGRSLRKLRERLAKAKAGGG